MIKHQTKLSQNQYWLKKNSFALVLLSLFWAIPTLGSEPIKKKVKTDSSSSNTLTKYSASSIPLEETFFGRWLLFNKEKLKKVAAYTSDWQETRSRALQFDDPKKLSVAGMLYLSWLPLELQQEIMQYLVTELSPMTVGIQEEDLSVHLGHDYIHNDRPHISHNLNGSMVLCKTDGCKPQPITLEYGYFKNDSIKIPPQRIDYLWRLIQEKSKKAALSDPLVLAVDTKNQLLFTGHDRNNNPPSNKSLTRYWQIAKPCESQQQLSNPARHSFELKHMLALLDAENSRTTKPNDPLTQNSLIVLKNLKRKIGRDFTPEGHIPVEPFFVDEQLNNNQQRRQLAHEDAFIDPTTESQQQQ